MIPILKTETINSGHYSIISYWKLSFVVSQLAEFTSEVVLFLINNELIDDINEHDELLGEYAYSQNILRALLYQGLDPRYRGDVLTTKIMKVEVYRLLRDDGRLALNSYNETLINHLRDDTDTVVELLSNGFTLTEDLFKFFIENKFDDLPKILPYLSDDISVSDTIKSILDNRSVIYQGESYSYFEDMARTINQDDTIISLLDTEDIHVFQESEEGISVVRRCFINNPRIYTWIVFSIICQLINLGTTYSVIGISKVLSSPDKDKDLVGIVTSFSSLGPSIWLILLFPIGAILKCFGIDERIITWLGYSRTRFSCDLFIAGCINFCLAQLLSILLPLHSYGVI